MTTVLRAALLAVPMLLLLGCDSGTKLDVDRVTTTAAELRDNGLYQAAIEEYSRILDAPGVPAERRGSASYLVGRIYFDDLKDFEQAAAYFVRARALDPNAEYEDNAARDLVACLEKIGRHSAASRQLRDLTDIDSQPADPQDPIVARVGDKDIHMSEIRREIDQMPASVQQDLKDPAKLRDYVRQYAGLELVYRAALREGYDRDPDVLQAQEQILRSTVLDKFLAEKVVAGVQIDTADIRNFYLANKDTRYGGAALDSIRGRVIMEYQQQKAGSALGEYINELAAAEQFEVYEQNVK